MAKKEIVKTTDAWRILDYPHLTEKSISNVEEKNELVFIVKKGSSKKEIKKAIEDEFNVKVGRVNMLTDTKGRKKAFVKLKPEYQAIDIATRLGMI